MERILLLVLIVLSSWMFTSCFKEDERIEPHEPGDFLIDTARLTDTYAYQVYYNLEKNSAVISQSKTIWDLGFDNSPLGWKVILNSSCFMRTAFLPGQFFGSSVDTSGVKWLFNPSDGGADSLAFGAWFRVIGLDTIGKNQLVVIDRGMNEFGVPRGFSQMVIDSLKNGIFYFRIASFDGSNIQSFSVKKGGFQNYKLFSISNPENNYSEPDNNDWDLLFTQYTTLLFTNDGDPYPYLVTGVLLNKNGVEVAIDSLHTFDEINYEKVQSMRFSKLADEIGYLWKLYNFDNGTYTVQSHINYILRDVNGYLYKFRFVGFTNRKLEKGYISFEYQRL